MDENDTALILLLLQEKKKKRFRRLIERQRIRNRSGGISRAALLHPKYSSFMKPYNSGDDPSLIALYGFDHASFNSLPEMFTPFFLQWSPYPQMANGEFHMRTSDRLGGQDANDKLLQRYV